MSLNDTASAERIRIGFFGSRNAGKSSVVNALTGQDLAVVSDTPGTTTDPVKKAMEILPLGPVVIVDTPGFDDVGALGARRVEKTKETLRGTDIAVLVTDVTRGMTEADRQLVELFREHGIPFLVAENKQDLVPGAAREGMPGAAGAQSTVREGARSTAEAPAQCSMDVTVKVSAKTGEGIWTLKERIAALPGARKERFIVRDLVEAGDTVVLVIPIDSSAPKGRIILPQQQVLRECLDANVTAVCCQAVDLSRTLDALAKKPRIVITDSQAFRSVAADCPDDIPLTSFSILFARYKGDLAQLVKGAEALDTLADHDKILVSEGCTHHRQCEDIGTFKLPNRIRSHTGSSPSFEFTSGGTFPDDLSPYALVLHCGGCMLNEREMKYRLHQAAAQGVPMTNYGIAIAHMNGILGRSLRPLRKQER